MFMMMIAGLSRMPQAEAFEMTPDKEISDFEAAVNIIKKYETLHSTRHWPLIGYGHKVLPGEKYSRNKALSESEADALLRKDLLKNCAVFRSFGKDSLLLGVLAYNIGSGAVKRSTVYKKLQAGDRNIRDSYLAHSRYKGKVHTQIKNRRIEEFDALYISDQKHSDKTALAQNIMEVIFKPLELEFITHEKFEGLRTQLN